MAKKTPSILVLSCFVFTMVSCQVRKIVTTDSITLHDAHKTRVLSVHPIEGECVYFRMKDPGRIADGTVTGNVQNSEGKWEEKTFPLSTLLSLTIKKTSLEYTMAAVIITAGFLYSLVRIFTGWE